MRAARAALKVALSLAAICLAWWAVSAAASSPLIPGPYEVCLAVARLSIDADTWLNVSISLARVLVGVGVGSAIGFALGIAPRYSGAARFIVESIVEPLLESVPALCWALIFAVLFGLSGVAPILVVAASITPFFVINLWEGVKELDESLIEMGRAFTDSRLRVFRLIVLPMLYPYILAALRSSFEVAWKVVILGEVFGAVDGVGYMLWLAFSSYDVSRMLAWTAYCAMLIAAFDHLVFATIDRRLVRRWRR